MIFPMDPTYLPWMIAIVSADLALIVVTMRLVLRSDRLRRKWLWISLSIVWPIFVIIVGEPKFRRKWLWTAFSIIAPSLTIGTVQHEHVLMGSVPIDLVFGGSTSLAALIVLGWWIWGPVLDQEPSAPHHVGT